MARSDLLIALVKAGSNSSDPRFRSVVEALIADERARQHNALAEQLAAALRQSGPPEGSPVAPSKIADLLYELSPERTLESVILSPDARSQVNKLVEEHQRSELLLSYGLEPRNRLLLVGPPGNGKTSLAHGLANALMVPLYVVRYEGLIGSYLGETASRLRRVFDHVRQRRCVIFLDEFDTIAKERGDVHETGEIKRVVSALLLQMDSLPPHVVVVTATNHSELLDRAVWRRFQLQLTLGPPAVSEIKTFLTRLFARSPFAESLKPSGFAVRLKGATFSEIEEMYRDIVRTAVLESPNAEVSKIARDRVEQLSRRVAGAKTARRAR